VLNNLLSVFDLEKLYIPPQLDETQGLYGNQLLCEQFILEEMNLQSPSESHLLDMGCGRGRISHHFATLTGGQVSGYNIDPNQLENAVEWAAECGMSDRLHFQVERWFAPSKPWASCARGSKSRSTCSRPVARPGRMQKRQRSQT
jgi:sterol 24-C-methyltransferase